jgi:peptidoglycan hydrolase CwlO-like protein
MEYEEYQLLSHEEKMIARVKSLRAIASADHTMSTNVVKDLQTIQARNVELETAYSKLLVQAESMSVMMQCPWKEGSHAEVAWRKEQDDIFNEFWDDDEVNAREAFKEHK